MLPASPCTTRPPRLGFDLLVIEVAPHGILHERAVPLGVAVHVALAPVHPLAVLGRVLAVGVAVGLGGHFADGDEVRLAVGEAQVPDHLPDGDALERGLVWGVEEGRGVWEGRGVGGVQRS